MSHVTRRGPVKPTLNITPLIDVVFLLIVFFMIVNNIVTDEVPELKLPDLDDPEVYPPEGEGRVIVNILPMQDHMGDPGPGTPVGEVLARTGEVRAVSIGRMEWDILEEGALKAFQEYATITIRDRAAKAEDNKPTIMLRVDAAVYYGQVLPIMNTLQQAMAEGLDPDVAAQTPIHLVAYQGDK